VVLGNEEYGITEDLMKACDDFVHLPMSGNKNSVNGADAFTVIDFHISGVKASNKRPARASLKKPGLWDEFTYNDSMELQGTTMNEN